MSGRWAYILIALIAAAYVALAIHASNEWDKFKQDHHCKVVGNMAGESIPAIGADGKFAVGYVSPKTGYQCDDGVTYWR